MTKQRVEAEADYENAYQEAQDLAVRIWELLDRLPGPDGAHRTWWHKGAELVHANGKMAEVIKILERI